MLGKIQHVPQSFMAVGVGGSGRNCLRGEKLLLIAKHFVPFSCCKAILCQKASTYHKKFSLPHSHLREWVGRTPSSHTPDISGDSCDRHPPHSCTPHSEVQDKPRAFGSICCEAELDKGNCPRSISHWPRFLFP